MGPESLADFYLKLIKIFQQKYGCRDDADYPEMYLYNLPLPDVVDKRESDTLVFESLEKGIKKLEKSGSDFIVCPCNTANVFLFSVKSKVPIINLIDITCKKAKQFKKVGLLGTELTISSKAYQNRIKNVLEPSIEVQKQTTQIILRILEGKKQSKDKKYLLEVIQDFTSKGCDAVILGCTELPLLISENDANIEILDTIQILAEETVSKSRGGDSK